MTGTTTVTGTTTMTATTTDTDRDLPGIPLTHGLWHGAWCWNDVAACLADAASRPSGAAHVRRSLVGGRSRGHRVGWLAGGVLGPPLVQAQPMGFEGAGVVVALGAGSST